jgi:hypothetical protein
MIKEILNLAVLNAFKVDPADVSYPLHERLPGKQLALINWGPSTIKISFATKAAGGMEVAPEELQLSTSANMAEVVQALKARTDCDCVAILYSAANLYCEAQNGVRAEPGDILEKRLRTDAKGLIGSAYEEDKVYQILLAPDHQTRVIFAANKTGFSELEKGLQEGGLKIMRAQLSPYALMNAFLADETWKTAPAEDTMVLAAIVSQCHVMVADFNGERFAPEIFRATPLFLTKETDNPEFIEQVRTFFTTCAETAALAKRVFGKTVVFRWACAGNSAEASLDLGTYLQDRVDIQFERWNPSEANVDFKALVSDK